MKAYVIGLTGQTGAGKSTVSEYAADIGCGVISADSVAREALMPGSECMKRLCEVFGDDIADENGNCLRAVLAKRAFADRESTDLLNSITHPWIIARVREYIDEMEHKNIETIVFDASQLFESGGEVLCDAVIVVTAPAEIRLDRIMSRDGIGRDAASLRMNAQFGEDYYSKKAHYIIDGSESIDGVRSQFRRILECIRKTRKQG